MFICEFCGGTSKPNETSQTIVTKRRKVLYGLFDKNENQIGKKMGWEIVEEKRACRGCNAQYQKKVKEN